MSRRGIGFEVVKSRLVRARMQRLFYVSDWGAPGRVESVVAARALYERMGAMSARSLD